MFCMSSQSMFVRLHSGIGILDTDDGAFNFDRASYLLYFIERAKKCLDFSATLYILHLFICIIYGGWPSSVAWWILNATGLALMALLGEYLCVKRELREIPIARRLGNTFFLYDLFVQL